MKKDKKPVWKRIVAGVMIFVILTLCGCGSKKAADNHNTEAQEGSQPSATVIFYGAGGGDLQGDMTESVLYGMLGMYKTSGINYVAVLGGQNKWSERYFADLLDTNDEELATRTGWFHVNVDALNEKLDELGEEFGIDPLDFGDKMLINDDIGLHERLNKELFCADILPQVEGTEVTPEYPIEDGHTLERTLNIVREQFSSDDYVITFSGHGGGSMEGVCYTEKNKDGTENHLSIPAIDEACRNAGFGDDVKFDLMAFDACCMGGIELGVRLSNYYEYMIGSEVSQVGGLNQCIIVRSIVDNRTDENLAYCIAHAAYARKYNDMSKWPDFQTGAMFFGPNGNNAAAAIDTAASALLDAAQQDENLKDDIYDALKKAMIYSFPIDENYDGRDLFISLQKTLNEKGITQFDEVIQDAISGINDFMVDNWYVFGSKPVYNSNEGGVIPESAEDKEKYLNHDLCGGSICSISYPNFVSAYSEGSVEDFNDNGAYRLKEFDERYYQRYKDCGFDNYAQLIMECAKYLYQEDFYFKKQNLAGDLADPAGADYQDITNIHWTDDVKEIQMDILNYGNEIATDTSGDSLIDFVDTTSSCQAYLTRKMSVTRKSDGKTMDLDYIIGNKSLSINDVDADRRRFLFSLSGMMRTNIQFVDNLYADGNAALDIIVPMEKNDDYYWRKVDVIKAAFSLEEEEATKIADNYEIYEGYCKINGVVSNNGALHLFKRIDEFGYQYEKTVLVESSDGQNECIPVEHVEAIKFKHYYLKEDNGSQGGTGTGNPWHQENEYQPEITYYDNNVYWINSEPVNQTVIYVGETDSENGKSMGFLNTGCLDDDFHSVYDNDMYWYSSDMLNQLYINNYEAESIENDPQKYGYYITADPIIFGNRLVLFNKNGEPLKGSGYAQLPVYGNIQS